MRHTLRSLIASLMCLCLCMSLAVPASAVNTEGITFTAVLDQNTFTVSESAQTVTMDIVASAPVSADGIGGTITWDSSLALVEISNTTEGIAFENSRMNLDTGLFGWSAADAENAQSVTNIARATFTIPANTPAGTYTVGVKDLELTRDYGDVWESGTTVTASFTITEPVVAEGYTIALSTLTATPTDDDAFTVNVSVTHSEEEEKHFAAGQFHVTYDNSALTLNSITANRDGSNLTTKEVEEGTTTTVKVADYGADKLLGNEVYTLNFTALTPGNTKLALSGAGFTTKDNATVNDLETSTCGTDLGVNVLKKTFEVTLPDYGFGTTGGTTVTDGGSFTFYISDPYYDYGAIMVTMNGVTQTLAPNADGSYTIQNVTGKVEITTEKKEARSFDVTFDGEYESGEDTATYMTNYQFKLKPDKAADTTNGYSYTLKSITINDVEYKDFTTEDSRTYTIPGKDIKGEIVITIEKNVTDPKSVNVSYTGHYGSVKDPANTVGYGADYTMTLDKISGYHYTVTAKMGGNPVAVIDNGDGTYTIQKVTGELEIHISRTVNTDGVSVDHYLTLEASNMYLIRKDPAQSGLDENYIPTYDDNLMYWSSRYNAYCYLIISSETINLEAEKAKIELVKLSDTVTKLEIPYDMNVNMSSKVDAADAQLVYNMYSQPTVTEFTEALSMLKFLKADVAGSNESPTVDVNDAVAIINSILGTPAAQ